MKIDGIEYDVPIQEITRTFDKDYKYQVMTEDGKRHSEIRGVYVNYTVVFGGLNKTQYDELINAIHKPTENFTVELPYNNENIELLCDISLKQDYIMLENDTERIWDELTVTFEGVEPLEVS